MSYNDSMVCQGRKTYALHCITNGPLLAAIVCANLFYPLNLIFFHPILGLYTVATLTSSCYKCSLRFRMWDIHGRHGMIEYGAFSITENTDTISLGITGRDSGSIIFSQCLNLF